MTDTKTLIAAHRFDSGNCTCGLPWHECPYVPYADALEAAEQRADALAALRADALAALRAEWGAERGWEYGSAVASDPGDATACPSAEHAAREVAEWNRITARMTRRGTPNSGPAIVVRRQPAGPWLPVEHTADQIEKEAGL